MNQPLKTLLLAVSCLVLASMPARAELIEEIVAWVNGEVITLSDYQEEEQIVVAGAYRQYTGDELDQQVERLRQDLLQQLIDRKILVDFAQRLYDMDQMGEVFLKSFKQQQNITSDEEFQSLLEQEGMSIDDIKIKLVEMFAPEEVLRFEVTSRVYVNNGELETFYAENQDKFVVPAEVTLREVVLRAADAASKDRREVEAEAVLGRLQSGEDFATVAQEVSEAGTREEGGLLGPIKIAELSEVLRGPASTVPVGSLSAIVEAPYGFHIVRVESRTDEHIQPLDEVRDRLRTYLQERKQLTEIQAFLEKARANSQWCVKPKYESLIVGVAPTSCSPD